MKTLTKKKKKLTDSSTKTTKASTKKKKVDANNNEAFDDDAVDALTTLEGIRKRYDMYIGSQDPAGHLFSEAIDNSVDEAMNGYGNTINVVLDTKENRITVEDYGRGLPLYENKKLGKPTIEVLFTHLHSGSKYNSRVIKSSGGKNGVLTCVL